MLLISQSKKPVVVNHWLRIITCTATTALMSLSLQAGVKADDYKGPITITQGGTYSGNWQSFDPNVPAVNITTTDPVVIENSSVKGPGQLIDAEYGGTNLTVRNTYGYGIDPNGTEDAAGEFVKVYKPNNLSVEHCYTDNIGGVYVSGDRTRPQSLKIRYNRAHNVNGHLNSGNNVIAHYIQLDKVQNTPGVEIAWNEVINEPYNSKSAEIINVYLSSGTPDSWISIHDNYIQGSYTGDPGNNPDGGGGILLGDGGGEGTDAPAFVEAYNNQVISTTNIGIATEAGHDTEFYNNRIISSGILSDGTRIAGQNVGMTIYNLYSTGAFYNNSEHDNTVGWVGRYGGRNDWWFPDCSSNNCTNYTALPNPITLDTENAEYQIWLDKLSSNNVTVGPDF